MSQTAEYIPRLSDLQDGERARLRALAGQPLDRTLHGFDLFVGIWWPLRAANERTPRREPSWLVAKLSGTSSVPHVRPEPDVGPSLPGVLGKCEPREDRDSRRFRTRFDAIVCSSLSDVETHLHWSLREIAKAVTGRLTYAGNVTGIDWVLLLDDLSLWDKEFNPKDTWQKSRLNAHEQLVHCHEKHRTPQELWACEYLHSVNHRPEGANHAD